MFIHSFIHASYRISTQLEMSNITCLPAAFVDDDEQWCWARDQRYPTDLIQLPFVQTTEEPERDNSASPLTSSLAVTLLTALLAAWRA